MTEKSRLRNSTSYTLSPETRESLRLLAKAVDLPQSRILDQLIRARCAGMTPEERRAVDALRAAEAAMEAVAQQASVRGSLFEG